MVTVADVGALARTLPRSSEHLIHDRVKFHVKPSFPGAVIIGGPNGRYGQGVPRRVDGNGTP
jgi:hypothetical protein